jgi:hypothetical protein
MPRSSSSCSGNDECMVYHSKAKGIADRFPSTKNDICFVCVPSLHANYYTSLHWLASADVGMNCFLRFMYFYKQLRLFWSFFIIEAPESMLALLSEYSSVIDLSTEYGSEA